MQTNAVHRITFGVESIPWLRWEFLGNQVWQYLAFLGYVIAAAFLARLTDVAITRGLKAPGGDRRIVIAERLLKLLRGPLKLMVFVVLLHVGVIPLNKPALMQDYLNHGFGILAAVVVTHAAIKVANFAFEIWRDRLQQSDERDRHAIVPLLEKVTRIFIICIAALVTADNNGIKVGGILASVGLTGLAVALAAQETRSNLLGSIVILADSPFFLGDHVKIDTYEGVVEHIGVRSTRLRTNDGDVVTIPNRTVAGTAVVNFSKTTAQMTSHGQPAGRTQSSSDTSTAPEK